MRANCSQAEANCSRSIRLRLPRLVYYDDRLRRASAMLMERGFVIVNTILQIAIFNRIR